MENSTKTYEITGTNSPHATPACAPIYPRVRTIGLGLILLLFCTVAYADEEPLQLDSSHWMSFDHYKDADKRNLVTPTQTSTATPTSESITPPVLPAASTIPIVAAPTRPVDLPAMPGLNKGFSVQVNSTEDESAASRPAVIDSNTQQPDIHLSDRNWQTPSSTPQAHKSDDDNGDETAPQLNVRMTFLPNQRVTPTPSPDHASAQQLGHAVLEKKLAEQKAAAVKEPEKAAVCAAIDAYKKQQLDAIQSDRQTLKALQDAINTLGLQKQLGFMTGNNGALTNVPDGPIPASIDAPATSIR